MQRDFIEKDIEALRAGLTVSSDLYIPFLYEKSTTVFDYLTDCLTFVCESGNIKERLKSIYTIEKEDITTALEKGTMCPKSAKLRLTSAELQCKFNGAFILKTFRVLLMKPR